MTQKIIFSGIQPSGNLHIGNYIGAIRQWVKLQDQMTDRDGNELIFCIVDLHAITVYQEPKILREKIKEVAALYVACGIDPQKAHIFVQSENPDHSCLAWIFDCIIPLGWMKRMTQFKDKSATQKDSTTVGLFNYPALMAADILLYDTTHVPVGEDQRQHIELTRDIAERFNKIFSPTFSLPRPMIDKSAPRIMSLQSPRSKMSKSDKDPGGTVNLLDPPEEIRNKIRRAVTDSGKEIRVGADKPALTNLLTIYAKFSGKSVKEIELMYQGKGYADFKNDLAEVVIAALKPIQQKYQALRQDSAGLEKILDDGRNFAGGKSAKKTKQVRTAVGLGRYTTRK
ncbi:tryptophan--tRNA ligase [Candidatus Roizmanbacteria bacterium]|nr:tryptophan--tRNA ligase [Candidatus Roizmanbacteria bacterium]